MKSISQIAFLILIMTFFNGYVFGQKNPNKHRRGTKTVVVHKNNRRYTTVVHTTRYPRNKVVVVKRRNVRTIPNLGAGYVTVVHRGRNYYYHGGRYYNQFNNGYTVIAAPRGLRIKFLPVGNRRILIGSVPHYYYMGTYYRAQGNEYEAVEPTVGTVVPELPEDNVEEVTIDGQSYLEYDNILYKTVVTNSGLQYEVVGKLDD